MRPVRIPDVSDSAENDLLPDVTQSSWLSSCLRRTLFASGREFDSQLDYIIVDSLSTYQDVFRAVFAAHGGSPPDDVIDALVDCASRRRSTPAHRRRRRSSRSPASGCRCRRRAGLLPRTLPATSAADRRTSHGETVHDGRTHLHRRRSIDDGNSCEVCDRHNAFVKEFNINQHCEPRPVVERIEEMPSGFYPYPDFTIVYKCNCGNVCENDSHRCVAVNSTTVIRRFELVRADEDGVPLETRNISEEFVEDVECRCLKPVNTSTRASTAASESRSSTTATISPTTSTTTVNRASTVEAVLRSSTFATTSPITSMTAKRCPAPFKDQPVCVCPRGNPTCSDIVRGNQSLDDSQLRCVQEGECYDSICPRRRTLDTKSGRCRRQRHQRAGRRRGRGGQSRRDKTWK